MLDIFLSTTISKSSISYLKYLITEHYRLYCNLFEQTLKPKFHILVHYPMIMKEVGPVRHIWLMRYEAFHNATKINS